MAGLIGSVLLVCGFLKLTGSYFAQRKMDNIMKNYNPTLIERLEDAAVEQMKSSTESEKHDIYNKTYKFLKDQDGNLDYSETVVLVDLLKHIDGDSFINDSVDTVLLTVDLKGFSNCIEYTVTNLTECDSTGFELAVQIYNAQKRINLSECYSVLVNSDPNHKSNIATFNIDEDNQYSIFYDPNDNSNMKCYTERAVDKHPKIW